MTTLISIIISGLSAGYIIEFINSLLPDNFHRLSKQILTPLINLAALFALGFADYKLFVYTPAAGFISLALMSFISKPVEIAQIVRGR